MVMMAGQKDVCSSSARTPKLQVTAEPPLTGDLHPTKERYSTSKGKGEGPTRWQEGEVAFRLKPSTSQTYLEGSNKTLCTPGPRDPTETARPTFDCWSVSCGGVGQQWPAVGTGSLAAADLAGTVYSLSPLGAGCHQAHHGATDEMTHELENNYSKEVLAPCYKTSRAHNRFPNLGFQQRD